MRSHFVPRRFVPLREDGDEPIPLDLSRLPHQEAQGFRLLPNPAEAKVDEDDEEGPPSSPNSLGPWAMPSRTSESHRSDPPPIPEARETTPPGVLVGATRLTPQWTHLGRSNDGAVVALDLNGCNTISLFGVQGFGKSYSLSTIQEAAVESLPGVNRLECPLATVLFHYHEGDTYEPEFLASTAPNDNPDDIARLLEEYGAEPQGVRDIVLLVPEGRLERRRAQYPNITVEAIRFSSEEIKESGWTILLGAYGNDSMYLRQLSNLMRGLRGELSLENLREAVEASRLNDNAKGLIFDRLDLAAPFIDDSRLLGDLLRPGRTIIVDVRDPYIQKARALELFVILMNVFSTATRGESSTYQGPEFSKLMVLDEAHKYLHQSEIVEHMAQAIREMRHHGCSVLIASQDPLSIPRIALDLSTVVILHRITSPLWVKHLKESILGLNNLSEDELARLEPGHALLWAQKATDPAFSRAPQHIRMRPRCSAHGGATLLATRGKPTPEAKRPDK